MAVGEQAQLTLGKAALAVEDCTAALEHDPRYVKALLRRATALLQARALSLPLLSLRPALPPSHQTSRFPFSRCWA